MAAILIVDSDEQYLEMLSGQIGCLGHDAACALSCEDGWHKLTAGNFAVMLISALLPDGDGLSLLPRFKDLADPPEVIILAADVNAEEARSALEQGAWDYVEKPLLFTDIKPVVESALTYREQTRALNSIRTFARGGIIGNSGPMKACLDLAAHAAESDVNVLICGETGTGKELLARVIHANSSRANGPLIVVDCAALPEHLAESMLFGHKKGAFTGADSDKDGLVKQADGGTLFLDELGELPLALQKTFLRVLQEKCFRPVGAKHEIKSNFRLIAATNRNLAEMAGEGKFRDDLLFRVHALMVNPPPLRERKQDIAELALSRIALQCRLRGSEPKKVSTEFLETLQAYSWPGNVRELFNVLDGCLAQVRGEGILIPQHLPVQLRIEAAQAAILQRRPAANVKEQKQPLRTIIPELKVYRQMAAQEAEKKYLHNLTSLQRVDVDSACQISGLSRSRFYELLKKYRLPAPRQAFA